MERASGYPPSRTNRREHRRDRAGTSADEINDLNSLADRIGVHGNRYNDHHMALIGR
jgi:hypothetical protein